MIKQVVVCDLDSTLFDSSPRHHLVPTENKHANETWHEYSRAHLDDTLIEGMAVLVRLLQEHTHIYVLSGRMDVAYETTRAQLDEHRLFADRLRLRADSELGSVAEFKIGVLREWMAEPDTEIVLMLDDFPDLCAQVTAELGIPTVTPMLPAHYVTSMPGL